MIKFGSKKNAPQNNSKALAKPNSASSSPSRSWIISESNAQYNADEYNSYKYNVENDISTSSMPLIGKLRLFYQLAITISLSLIFLIIGIYLFYSYHKNNYSYNFLSSNMTNIALNISSLNNIDKDLLNKDINQFNNMKQTIGDLSSSISTLYTIDGLDKDTLAKFESDFNITKNKVNYINNSQNFLVSTKTHLTNINNFLNKFYLDITTSSENSMLNASLTVNDLVSLNKIMSNIYVIKSDISLLLTNNSNMNLLNSINKNNSLMKSQFSLLEQMSNTETKKRLIYYYNIYVNTIDKYITDITFKLTNFNKTLNAFGTLKDNDINWILSEFDNTLLKLNKYRNIYLYLSLFSFSLFLTCLLLIIIINKYEDNKKYENLKGDYDLFDKDLNKIIEDLIIISQKDITHKISLNGNVKLLTLVDSINQTLNNVREKFDSEINNLQTVSTFINDLPNKNTKLKEALVDQRSMLKNNDKVINIFTQEYPKIKNKLETVKKNINFNSEGLVKLENTNKSLKNGLIIVLNKDNELNERLIKMNNSINEILLQLNIVLELSEKINMYTLNSKIQTEKSKSTVKNITLINDKVSNSVKELTLATQKIKFFVNNLNSDMEKSLNDIATTITENEESKETFERLFTDYFGNIIEENKDIKTNFQDIYSYISKLEAYINNISEFKRNISNTQLDLLNMLESNKLGIELNKKTLMEVLFNIKTYTNKNSGD